MITCKLYGRRANQLFQIAHAICYGVQNKRDVLIPKETVDEKAFPSHRFSNLVYTDGNNTQYREPALYREKSHAHNIIPLGLDNICFDGYWQSYKYLKGYERMLRQLLELPKLSIYKNKCAIHIRRGDYLTLPNHHPVCPMEYYQKAMDLLYTGFGVKHFLVFSDDIKWAKLNLVNFKPDVTINFSEPGLSNEMSDLKHMMCYRYQIIANSSFSLFPALLNPALDKVIICPDKSNWFGPANAHLETKDLYPDDKKHYIPIKY